MRDFTTSQYNNLLKTLFRRGFVFQTFCEFLEKPLEKITILRHDVDRLPLNSLKTAQIEYELGIKGSYYFRIVSQSFNENIIKQIAELGHEIGYHYEDLTLSRGNIYNAYYSFCRNLEMLRKLYPINTICMHGSPLSKWDNRDIWIKYDYHSLGIVGEPYFDIDYSQVFYITDTGRKWNNKSSNVRDTVNHFIDIPIKSTDHFISLIEQGKLPDHIMINTHPHRWFEGGFGWYKEFLLQNVKNVVKGIIVRIRYDNK